MSSPKNRLAAEKSPYLQQHAHNPVDWYPWGEEAFAAARSADKPIFLSIGYSTCHWCHVMAHESFENPAIAAVMNRRYINIKVDREERPDVDALYMTAVQSLTGSGGWPMSVWLTPDLKPFYGGTYFPPEERWGRPGFPDVMEQLADIYVKERGRVTEASEQICDLLRRVAAGDGHADLPPADEAMKGAYSALEASFDSRRGGFSPAPKFPMPVYLELLLDHHARTGTKRALEMAAFTFRQMAAGGLYDHLGGGFARYSTDDEWLVPHFEKMLYDNAQLLRAGAALSVRTQDPIIRDSVLGTAAYLLRDLRHPDGGFFSAEDADSEGKEGAFYLWTLAQFRSVLGDAAHAAAARYGVTPQGNFRDPHTGEVGLNVLSLVGPEPADPAAFDVLRRRLFDARLKRPRPHRDEKILTEWNGLAISGLARAGFFLDDQEMIAAAARAADFIERHLYDAASGRLFRRWRDGDRAGDGQLGDHAMLVEGLLDLFEATGEPSRLSLAMTLQRRLNDLFHDSEHGGYFTSAVSPDLLVRMKEDGDNVIPSGNATAARNGFRLAAMTGDDIWRRPAEATLHFFAAALSRRPSTVARMAPLLAWAEGRFKEIVLVGDPALESTKSLLNVLRSAATRDAVIIPAWDESRFAIGRLLPDIAALPTAPTPAVRVCRDFACLAPAVDAASLRAALAS